MGRTAVLALVVVVLAAGCGGVVLFNQSDATAPSPEPERSKVVVLVRDGDTGAIVGNARVRIRWQSKRVNENGAAAFRVRWVGRLKVRGVAPGYEVGRDRLRFGKRPFQVLRLYRPRLQWPIYGAGPRRTQTQNAIQVRPPFRFVWSRRIGFLEFPAVVSNGVAYVSNLSGRVRAISMRNGHVLWGRQTPNGKMAASPAVVGRNVIAHGMDGRVWVFDRETGDVRWTFRIGSPIESSPVVLGGVDYFGAWNGNVYALDLQRRKLLWVFRSGYKITSSVAAARGRLFVGDYGGRVWALSRGGRVVWRSSVGGRVYGTPAVAAGRLFVPSSTGRSLTAFSLRGRRLWTYRTGAYVYSSPAVWGGRVFFGSHNGVLYSVSARNGRTLWRYASGRPISGAPTVVARVVYFGNTGRRLYGLDARTGRRLLRFRDGNYVPVSGNGGKLLLHGVSRLYAVESPVKKLLIGAALLAVLLAGAVAAYVFEKRYESRDILGSSTEEFVATEAERTPPPGRPTEVVWPFFGYDTERTKAPALFREHPPYRAVWTFRARALLEFPPAIAYKRAYIANNSGRLFAINVRTGKARWSYLGHRCTASSPAVANGTVFQTFMNRPPCNARGGRSGLDGALVALNARKGRVRWRRQIGPSESSPVVANGLVYVGDWRGYVYAFQARTGRLRWSFKTGDDVKGGVAVAGRRLYAGSYDGRLYALDARTGRLLWRSSAQNRLGGRGNFYSTPVAAYGRVYIGNTDGKVYSYGATTGTIRWSHHTGSFVYSSPAVWQQRVYAGSHDKFLYCFDAATGRVRWKFRANGKISGAPTVINGLVYFSTVKGRTYALDARTSKQKWTWPDGQYTAVVADRRRLYVVGYSKLYALVRR